MLYCIYMCMCYIATELRYAHVHVNIGPLALTDSYGINCVFALGSYKCVYLSYLGIKLLSCCCAHAMDTREQLNCLLLFVVDIVKATEVSARDNLVNLVCQSLSDKRQISSLLDN